MSRKDVIASSPGVVDFNFKILVEILAASSFLIFASALGSTYSMDFFLKIQRLVEKKTAELEDETNA